MKAFAAKPDTLSLSPWHLQGTEREKTLMANPLTCTHVQQHLCTPLPPKQKKKKIIIIGKNEWKDCAVPQSEYSQLWSTLPNLKASISAFC